MHIKYKTGLRMALLFMATLFACKVDYPTSERFGWTLSGSKLAVLTYESNELMTVDIQNDAVKRISVIDSCDEEKTFIYAPSWSFDEQYLLYSKADLNRKQFRILVYSIADQKTTIIGRVAVTDKKDLTNIQLPAWSPGGHDILWMDWNPSVKLIYVSTFPENNSRIIRRVPARLSGVKWTADGGSVAYGVYQANDESLNGLWQVKKDGEAPSQIFSTEKVTNWSRSPNGQLLALNRTYQKTVATQNNVPQQEPAYEIIILDSTGAKIYAFELEKSAASPLYWSANNEKLAFLSQKDDLNNVWVVDLMQKDATKMTFDNAEELFGWIDENELLYTQIYPDKLVPQKTADEEMWGILEFIKGRVKYNQLIATNEYRPQRLDENVYGLRFAENSKRYACFLRAEPEILSSNYTPVIHSSKDSVTFLARTFNGHLVAADWYYLNREYAAALDHLQKISSVRFLNTDKLAPTNRDSLNQEQAIEAFYENEIEKGTLLRTVLNLRQLKQHEKARDLFRQYVQGCQRYMEKLDPQKDDLEGFFWNSMRIYGKFQEFEAAVRDFSELRQKNSNDSLFVGYANWTLALLAFESNKKQPALDFIEKAIHTLPSNERNDDDFVDMVSLLLINSTSQLRENYGYLMEFLFENAKIETEKSADFYRAIGDYYVAIDQPLKAANAFQIAVTKKFDTYEIWGKIIDLAIQ